jgi:ElaB/YqjD/DUF883 family membrane-anchored ribosome-binding protein
LPNGLVAPDINGKNPFHAVERPGNGASRKASAASAALELLPMDSCCPAAVAAMEAPMAEARVGPNGGREANDDLEALRSDLDTLRQDFATLVSTLQAEGLAQDLQTAGQQRLRSTERMIQEQPLMSVAIAFASGLIVSRLLNR